MHRISIPQSVIDRVIQRHGREHVFDTLDPAKTALVVVDMQNGFLMPGVAQSLCLAAQDIVPNINRLARVVRATGGTVVWIKTAYYDETRASWSILYEMTGAAGLASRAAALGRGGIGYELWAGMEALPEDLVVEKTRYSAFIQGSSDLAAVLRDRGIDTIIVTGTVTNVCCESTARDAMMLNFRTVMVTDGNAAMTDEEHNAALAAFYLIFGDIMSTDELAACLERHAGKRQIAAE